MWRYKLQQLLSAPPVKLTIEEDGEDGYSGKYIWIHSKPFALGRQIGEGDEARVFELISLRLGYFSQVVKICKYPPSHKKYHIWATNFRDEMNPYSILPDIEKAPAQLISIPGGKIKVQEYQTPSPETDWGSGFPAFPIIQKVHRGDLAGALSLCDELLKKHGEKGILLEQKAIILQSLNRLEDARTVFEDCIKSHTSEGNSGRLCAANNLALLLMRLHEFENLPGLMQFDLGEGKIHSQQIIPFRQDARWDEIIDLSDVALEVLIDALYFEPYFVPALLLIAEIISNGGEGASFLLIAQALKLIDPNNFGTTQVTHLAEQITHSEEQSRITSDRTESAPEMPSDVLKILEDYERTYAPPIPEKTAQAESFYATALNYSARKEFGRAEDAINKSIGICPDEPKYALERCTIWCLQDEWNKAYLNLKNLIKAFPDDCDVYVHMGCVSSQLKYYKESCIAFQKALACNPQEESEITARLGDSYRRLGSIETGFFHLHKAYKWNSENPLIVQLLLLGLRDQSFRYQEEGAYDERDQVVNEAFEIIDRAHNVGLERADFWTIKAQILAGIGRADEAISPLETALILQPTHPFAGEFLAGLKSYLG